MSIVAPSPQLKADMKKVGDVMLKEWLEKAGPEGKTLVDNFRK
jgi:TRAP-type transport system periplasmic protein